MFPRPKRPEADHVRLVRIFPEPLISRRWCTRTPERRQVRGSVRGRFPRRAWSCTASCRSEHTQERGAASDPPNLCWISGIHPRKHQLSLALTQIRSGAGSIVPKGNGITRLRLLAGLCATLSCSRSGSSVRRFERTTLVEFYSTFRIASKCLLSSFAPRVKPETLAAMPTSEEYRRRVEEGRLLASKAADPSERELLLRTAAQWERLADYKEKREGGSKPSAS